MFQAKSSVAPVNRGRLDAAAGEPPAKRPAKVIPAIRACGVALPERRPAELAAPDDQCVLQHAAILQVAHQAADGPSVSRH